MLTRNSEWRALKRTTKRAGKSSQQLRRCTQFACFTSTKSSCFASTIVGEIEADDKAGRQVLAAAVEQQLRTAASWCYSAYVGIRQHTQQFATTASGYYSAGTC
jgi:hypothetical protein